MRYFPIRSMIRSASRGLRRLTREIFTEMGWGSRPSSIHLRIWTHTCALLCKAQSVYIAAPVMPLIGRFFLLLCTGYYLLTLVAGAATVASEWRRIPASRIKKLIYLPLYPLFLLTYLPISLAALFRNVEWTPIRHTPTAEMHHMPGPRSQVPVRAVSDSAGMAQ